MRLRKFLNLFRRAPEAGMYANIAQEAHKVSARYKLQSDGGISITRRDGAVMSITPLMGGKFLVRGGIIIKEEGIEFGEGMMWLSLEHFLHPKAAP